MTFPCYLLMYCRQRTVTTTCPWVKPFCFRRLAIRTTTLSFCVELFLVNYHIVHWCYCDGLAWWRPPKSKSKRCCWSMLDYQWWHNNNDKMMIVNKMKINVCWKMRRARCWPLTFRGALFWCFQATLSSLMTVIILFHSSFIISGRYSI